MQILVWAFLNQWQKHPFEIFLKWICVYFGFLMQILSPGSGLQIVKTVNSKTANNEGRI